MSNTEDDSDDGLRQAASAIQQRLDCDAVLITRGDKGMMLLGRNEQPAFVKTAAREVAAPQICLLQVGTRQTGPTKFSSPQVGVR